MKPDDAMVANTGDEKQVKRARRKETDLVRQAANDVRWVLSSDPGRRFINRILAHCGMTRSTFARDMATAGFLSGQQDVAHALMDWIEGADEMALAKLLQQSVNERRSARAENHASRIISVTDEEE